MSFMFFSEPCRNFTPDVKLGPYLQTFCVTCYTPEKPPVKSKHRPFEHKVKVRSPYVSTYLCVSSNALNTCYRYCWSLSMFMWVSSVHMRCSTIHGYLPTSTALPAQHFYFHRNTKHCVTTSHSLVTVLYVSDNFSSPSWKIIIIKWGSLGYLIAYDFSKLITDYIPN